MSDFIQAFGLLIIIIVCITFIVKLLKQPTIVGYVLSGLFFSYFFASNADIHEQITSLSLIGITLLLFLMGFEFDFRMFRSIGKDLALLTIMQSVALAVVGMGLTLFFPFTLLERIYLTLAFTLASTLISARMIEDKKETGTLYGKITLGILVFQDIVAIAAMTFITVSTRNWIISLLSAMHLATNTGFVRYFLSPLLGFVFLFAFAFIMSRYLLNYALRAAAKFSDLLLILSMSICFVFAIIAMKLGYSDSIGAFIGGVVIANTIYKSDISSRLKPLVTFFNMLFFVGLGFQLSFDLSLNTILFAGLLVIASVIIKPIIVYVTFRLFGYDLKTSFLSSIHLIPLSEFGIILIAGGVTTGQIGAPLSAIITFATIASMVVSAYVIKYDKLLWKHAQPFLTHIDKFITKTRAETAVQTIDADVVFFGYYESGKEILETLRGKQKKIIVITNDPDHIDQLEEQGIACFFGSAVTADFFEAVVFSQMQLVVSSSSDKDDNILLLKHIKHEYPTAVTIVTARDIKDALELYKHNADYVIYPTYINEKQISVLLDEYTTDVSKVIQKKVTDMGRFQELLDEKKRLHQKNKQSITKNFFHDIDHLVGKLGEFQKVNERTIFHLFNKDERAERRSQSQSQARKNTEQKNNASQPSQSKEQNDDE